MVHLITYGNDVFAKSKRRIENQATSLRWFDKIKLYGPKHLDSNFKKNFKQILDFPKGGGYYIWKPYIIKKHLNNMNDGDILIYMDAGCSINPNGSERFKEYIYILKNSEEGCISFQMPHLLEICWTVKEVFAYFNINNDDLNITESGQIMATVRMFKKNANTMNIVSAWLNTLYQNPLLFTDYYNKNNQNKYLVENRYDQSIISILSKLYKTIILQDETYFEEGFRSKKASAYPFWATRLKG